MTLTLGIDVAKAKLDVALRWPDGRIHSKVVANTDAGFAELQAWLARQDGAGAHVCLEATGTYWEAVAEALTEAGYPVSVVNPARIKAYGAARQVRTKTDAVDARLIADFCASQHPPAWTPPPRPSANCGPGSLAARRWSSCAPKNRTGCRWPTPACAPALRP